MQTHFEEFVNTTKRQAEILQIWYSHSWCSGNNYNSEL